MNYLAIDYGSKNIGLAVAVEGVIEPILSIKNDKNLFENIKKTISDYRRRN